MGAGGSFDLLVCVDEVCTETINGLSDRIDFADLIYDPVTGNVTLDPSDTESGIILSFVLGTDQNNMRNENSMLPFVDVGTNTETSSRPARDSV